MKQELKNQYYKLIQNNDFNSLKQINDIFNQIDTLLLIERGKNQKPELLNLISPLEATQKKLYEKLKMDIESGEW